MTDNEAIKVLQYGYDLSELERNSKRLKDLIQAYNAAIKALDEIQQYRAIGTVEECREARERQSGKKPIKTPDCSDCKKECNKNCISFDCGKTYLCPTCHQNAIFNSEYDVFYKHCLNCGQKLDWSE